MKNLASLIFAFMLALCASAQDLYIGTFYVTSTDEEALYGDGNNKWMNRKTVITDMFKFEQPDVLGLQSLTSVQLAYIKSAINSTHALAEDILYKRTLELDTCGIVEGLPEGSTASWAKLRKEGKAFYVFNFCFSSELTVATLSATSLISFVNTINTEKLPFFVLGDLGVNETKTAYTRMNARYNDCYVKAPIKSAEYGTKNNFDLAANHGSERYDFIFASKTIIVKAYGQLQSAYFTAESDGSRKRRLPSTHFPVMAKVTIQ